jgi:RIO-like serine/threonine protein kinase
MANGLVKELRKAIRDERFVDPSSWSTYLVSDTVVGKLYGSDIRSQKWACNEFDIGKFLYEKGVSVPEMFELVIPDRFPFLHRIPINEWGVLMQKIDGIHIQNLEGSELDEAIQQYISELEKVLELGICPNDSIYNSTNSLFDRQQGRVFLIDFELWQKEEAAGQLDIFHQKLMEFRASYTHLEY